MGRNLSVWHQVESRVGDEGVEAYLYQTEVLADPPLKVGSPYATFLVETSPHRINTICHTLVFPKIPPNQPVVSPKLFPVAFP